MTHWECNACPFTTSDEDAARGHGYQPDGSIHSLSLVVEPQPQRRWSPAVSWGGIVLCATCGQSWSRHTMGGDCTADPEENE